MPCATDLQRLPSSTVRRRVHAVWHEAVAGALGGLTASSTGVEGAAVVQPRCLQLSPSTRVGMSAGRSAGMALPILSRPSRAEPEAAKLSLGRSRSQISYQARRVSNSSQQFRRSRWPSSPIPAHHPHPTRQVGRAAASKADFPYGKFAQAPMAQLRCPSYDGAQPEITRPRPGRA